MKRRTLLNGGTSIALMSLLAACGGGDSSSNISGSLEGYVPDIPGIGDDEDGYRHVGGLHTLPPSKPLDQAYLAEQTPGLGFSVRVRIGSQMLANVAVHIVDVKGQTVDKGVTDAEGFFAASQPGRRFMMAMAQTPQGPLYGFEYNSGAKFEPVIDVNLIGTLIYKLYGRLEGTPETLEYVLNAFFGLEYATDLTDLASESSVLDQEALRLKAEAAGVRIDTWLDQLIDQILKTAEEGFSEPPQSDADTTGIAVMKLSAGSIPGAAVTLVNPSCDDVPEYDSAFNEFIPSDIEALIRDNWSKAAKSLLGLAFTKGSAAAGQAWAGQIANFILGQALPDDDPHQRSLNAIQGQLSRLASAVSDLSFKADIALHKAALDTVISSFNRFANLIKDVEDRKRRHIKPSAAEIVAYNQHVIVQSRKLTALQTKLGEAHDLFIGLGSVPVNDSVLGRWHTAFRGRKFYTSVVENSYNELLDWFVLWNTKIYNYLFDAYATLKELDGQAIDTVQVQLLRDRLKHSTLAIETLRPKRLKSVRMFIDTEYNLAWVGGCNKVDSDSYMRLVPANIDMKNSQFGRSRYSLLSLMERIEKDHCSPLIDPGIPAELINSFAWRLPTKKNMDDSFGDYIKQGYLGEFKTKTKDFNWFSFADNCQIPRKVQFMRGDDGKTPIKVILSNGMQATYHTNFLSGVYWSLDASQYDLGNLKSKGITLAEREIRRDNPRATNSPGFYFFPVAELTASQLDEGLPWRKYEQQITRLRAEVQLILAST